METKKVSSNKDQRTIVSLKGFVINAMRKIDEQDIEVGDKTLRMYSCEHLIYQNMFSEFTAAEMLPELEAYKTEPYKIVQQSITRLQCNGTNKEQDISLVHGLIIHGNAYGLAAASHPATLGDLLWRTASIILECNGVKHLNELTK